MFGRPRRLWFPCRSSDPAQLRQAPECRTIHNAKNAVGDCARPSALAAYNPTEAPSSAGSPAMGTLTFSVRAKHEAGTGFMVVSTELPYPEHVEMITRLIATLQQAR